MRLGIIAAAGVSDSRSPALGERDASLVRQRMVMDDMGFEVCVLDPAIDAAEQLDRIINERSGQIEDLLFYASCLVAVVDERECFLCLDPKQPNVGDSLADLMAVLAGRYSGTGLVIMDSRYQEAVQNADMPGFVAAAAQYSVNTPRTGIGLIAAARPFGAHHERIPSRLTAGLLEAIDSAAETLNDEQAYGFVLQHTDFGTWPHTVVRVAGRQPMVLRHSVAPAVSEAQPPAIAEPAEPSSPTQDEAAPTEPAPASAEQIPVELTTPVQDQQPAAPVGAEVEAEVPIELTAPVQEQLADQGLAAVEPPIEAEVEAEVPIDLTAPVQEQPVAEAVPADLAPAPAAPPTEERDDEQVPIELTAPVERQPAEPPIEADVDVDVPVDETEPGVAAAPGEPPVEADIEADVPDDEVEPGVGPTPGEPPVETDVDVDVPVDETEPEQAPAAPVSKPKAARRPAPPSERSEVATSDIPRRRSSMPPSSEALPKVIIADDVSESIIHDEVPPSAGPPPPPRHRKRRAEPPPPPKRSERGSALAADHVVDSAANPQAIPPPPLEQDSAAQPAAEAAEVVEPAVAAETAPAAEAPDEPIPSVRPSRRPPAEAVKEHVDAGNEAFSREEFDDALKEYKKALGKLGTTTTPLRAEIYVSIGEVMRKKGKPRVAISNFDKALGIVPSDARALNAVIELHAEQGNWQGTFDTEQRLLAQLDEREQKFDHLLSFGDRWRDEAQDPQRAEQRYEQASELCTDRSEPLERLAKVFEATDKLDELIAVSKRLAETNEDLVARASAYFELGEYCMFEAHREQDAFAAFELALEANPEMLEALEVLVTVLAEQQEWAEIERIYVSMIERFERMDEPKRPVTVLAELHHRLTLLYRDHLEDPTSALKALDRAATYKEPDLASELSAAELSQEIEEDAKALVHLRNAARLEPRRADTYHSIFSLAQSHAEPETAYLAANVLTVLEVASEQQQAVFDQHRPDTVPPHKRPIRPAAWDWLRDEDAERSVDAVMRAVAPAVLRLRVGQLEAEGKLPAYPVSSRQDPTKSTISAVRSLSWACQFLGLESPGIYLSDEQNEPFWAPFGKHQTTVVGRGALSGRSLNELAFLAARHMVLRTPEHELVAHIQSVDELTACFLAALELTLGQSPAAGELGAAAKTLAGLLRSHQSRDEQTRLEHAVSEFTKSGGRVNLREWIFSVERCATRAGFVLCGDLNTAVSVLRAEKEPAFLSVDERIDDLFQYALSGQNLKIRQELGCNV